MARAYLTSFSSAVGLSGPFQTPIGIIRDEKGGSNKGGGGGVLIHWKRRHADSTIGETYS